MRKLSSVSAAAILLLPISALAQQAVTPQIVSAADHFLSSLDADQRQRVLYDFSDDAQRARWSNFPTGFVPRGGISFKQMTTPQRDAAMVLLATVLSPSGLEKVNEIRQADDDFKANGSKRGPPSGRPNGGPPRASDPNGPPRPPPSSDNMFGSDLYYISFVGKPSVTKPWMLQFGGHHLALNISIDGSKDVMTPSLTGAQPATFQLNGKTIRPLGRESDKAAAFLQSLTETEREKAILNYQISDLVLGPGQDGKTIAPEGLQASELNERQQAMLLDVIGEWTGILNEASATKRMAEIKADLSETWFAWSGPATAEPGSNITAYYRIQGPHLVIEYAPQRDEPANHVHTIYRDPTNDYGRAPAKK